MEDLKNSTQPDSILFKANDLAEVNYWSDKFGISKEELFKALRSGKTFAEAVENFVKISFAFA